MLHHIVYKLENTNVSWVVFIHGAGGSSTIWFKQINAYRKEYNVLLIDLRGHGRTKVDEEVNKKLVYSFPSIVSLPKYLGRYLCNGFNALGHSIP